MPWWRHGACIRAHPEGAGLGVILDSSVAVARDCANLKVFHLADELIVAVYAITQHMPSEERFGLQAQLRRAAISVASNIVEGTSRQSTADYCRFLDVARGSALECRYLLVVGLRLGQLPPEEAGALAKRYDGLSAALYAATTTLRQTAKA